MATVEIAFISPIGIGPLDTAYPGAAEMVTSSASSQVSTNSATGPGMAVVIVTSGGPVYASIGADPDAGTDADRRLIPAGAARTFGGVTRGHKVAIIDA